jgi:hypothetical protein
MFGNVDPMTNLDERSMMKHRWSPTPIKCGRINMLTHLMPGVVSGKYAIDGDASSSKCRRYWDSHVTPADFGHVKIILAELMGKLTGIHILVEIP